MTQTSIRTISEKEGQSTSLQGWLYNMRSSKKIHFLQLRDGSGIIQCIVAKQDVGDEIFEKVKSFKQEMCIRVHGIVHKDERSALGYEVIATDVDLLGESENYPISPKNHGSHFLHEHRHLWLRSRRTYAILKVRARVIKAIRDLLDGDGFMNVDTPIFTPNACEGTSTLFETEYFGQKAYLTQSGQLYNEANAAAFGKVYCFGPTFRAEKSKTRRHLTEFWMVEPEVAFLELDGLMDLCEWFVSGIAKAVLEDCREELELLDSTKPEDDTRELMPRLEALTKIVGPFPRVHYDVAIQILQKNGSSVQWGDDFGGEDETILTQQFDKPIIVYNYPAAVKAFYMKKDPSNPTQALSMDLLAPEGYGEIIGAGQREDSHDELLAGIQHHQLPIESFQWYLDLRKYGTFPHSGFGLGVERTVAWLCGLKHIREAIPYPRTIDRLTP